MINPDQINGGFEAIGAVLAWVNVYKLHKAKEIKGVFWPLTAFFSSWGIWNLYYYPALGQWLSFYGGLGLTLGNAVWVVLAIITIYKKKLDKK
jgi:hypothetical protein